MNSEISNWVMRAFVVLYAGVCAWCIMKDSTAKNNVENEKSIITMITDNSTQFESIEFFWIKGFKQEDNIDNIDNYILGEVVNLNKEQLKMILDANFYIEKGDNLPLGMYRPTAILSFEDTSDNRYIVVYSFMNAEVRFYINGEQKKSMMMYNSKLLLEKFNEL